MNKIESKILLPEKLSDVSELLKDGYTPVAGGTDLIVRRHAVEKRTPGQITPGKIFSCRKIEEMNILDFSDKRMTVGSNITLTEIIENRHTPQILKESLLSIAAPGIRNAATLTGNICNASPAADSLPALYILNAEINCSDGNTSRQIPIRNFITGPGKTLLKDDEIVVSVSFETNTAGNSYFRKVGTRKANALSKISVAAFWSTDDKRILDFRLAAGACAPVVVRSVKIEDEIIKHKTPLGCQQKDKILTEYSRLLNPIDDQRSSARYRKNTALKLIDDVLEKL